MNVGRKRKHHKHLPKGVTLECGTYYYNIGIHDVGGKQRVSGKRGGDLVAEFTLLFGARGWRIDRIPVSWFKDVRALGRVRAVPTNYRGVEWAQPYSIVAGLKERL